MRDALTYASVSHPRCIIFENVKGMLLQGSQDSRSPAQMLMTDLNSIGYSPELVEVCLSSFHNVTRRRQAELFHKKKKLGLGPVFLRAGSPAFFFQEPHRGRNASVFHPRAPICPCSHPRLFYIAFNAQSGGEKSAKKAAELVRVALAEMETESPVPVEALVGHADMTAVQACCSALGEAASILTHHVEASSWKSSKGGLGGGFPVGLVQTELRFCAVKNEEEVLVIGF